MWMGISEGLSSWTNPELLAAGASLGIAGWQGIGGRAVKGGVQYTKSSLKLGQQMHKGYKVGLENKVITFKEFTGV